MLAGKIGNGGWEESEHVFLGMQNGGSTWEMPYKFTPVSVNFDGTVMGRA